MIVRFQVTPRKFDWTVFLVRIVSATGNNITDKFHNQIGQVYIQTQKKEHK